MAITDLTLHGQAGGNGSNAAVSVVDRGSTFSNIRIRADGIGEDEVFAAGLVGGLYGSETTTISKVSFVGNLNGHLEWLGQFGGLVGVQYSPLVISNSYAQVNYTDTDTGIDSYGGMVGGLVANSQAAIQIANSYAALKYDGTGVTLDPNGSIYLGGLVGGITTNAISITHSFAKTQVQGFTGDTTSFGGLLGFAYNDVDNGNDYGTLDLSGNYFDADLFGSNQCGGSFPGGDSVYARPVTCGVITGQPNYFNNNSTNPPLDSWDFNNIWATTSGLPVFGRKSLTTVTPIPANRLTPKKAAVVTAKAIVPAQPPKPAEIIAKRKAAAQAVSTSKPSVAPKGVIAQLKRLVAHVPTAVLVSFPYVLFSLLLLAALVLLIEVLHQTARLQKLNLLLAEQRSVADKRDTFWHLAANYLRAPVTLLMGGADLLTLSKLDNAETRQLTKLSQRLQTKVAHIMQQIEHSHTLQGIKPPKTEKPRRVWTSVGFWLPVATVAILITLTNYVAHSWRNLNLSAISLASQVLTFLLAAFALYWVLSALGVVSYRRRNAEQLLERQEKALDTARLHLMRQTATELDADVRHVQVQLAKLSGASQAKPIMQEGVSRLRHLVDSFSLLISAQNHRLSGLSPAGATTSLDRVLKESLSELKPKITAKELTIDLPAKQDLRLPGSRDLNGQVLSSILANAIAFSPSGSTIRLGVEETETGVYLRVADNGPGITPVQQTHLFQPFTKADGLTGLQLDHDGLGINLYLDRQIMDYLGGDIAVHSAVGQGTVVELHWPHQLPATHPGMMVHPSTAVT